MNSKLLLIKAITLLFRESLQKDLSSTSAALINEVVATIPIPEDTMELNSGRDVIINLRSTAQWMAEKPNEASNKPAVLQRLRVNCMSEDSLYDAFVTGTHEAIDNDENKSICLYLRKELKTHINNHKVKDILTKASHQVRFNESTIDWNTFVKELCAQLEPYTTNSSDEALPGHVDSLTLDNVEELKRIIEKAEEEMSDKGILKCGWQAINRMMGEYDGMRRGDFVVVGALQHNFKTGFTLGLAKGWALYNKAIPDDPSKQPMIMHISVENNLTDNVMQLYVSLKENETGEPCSTTGLNQDEVVAYISRRMAENGYAFHMARYNPSDFTYYDLFDLIQRFEAQGYEIHAMVFDYLNMISKRGCTGGANGADIRDLFRRVRNFTSPRRILFVTPHQLSPDAKYLLRQGVDNFVKEVANKGYWDSCKAIDQEVDLEIIIHKEVRNGSSYLAVQRGKHRKVKVTPEEHLYTVLPFQQIAGIPDDINGEDRSLTHVGGRQNGNSESESEWWA